MDAKLQLKAFKTKIDQELKKYFSSKLKEAKKYSPHTVELIEQITDFTMRGGKRIRPALMYYSYLAHGGTDGVEALRATMAIELSETYLLIHDDIMDDTDLRRGGKTVHESYKKRAEEKYQNKINASAFGNSLGILAGDIACSLSNNVLAERKFKPDHILRAIHELNKVYTIEGLGQALDIISEAENHVTRDDVILIHQLKTVPYTFDGPLKIGAILAGAGKKEIDQLGKYSIPLGTAFQIQDDILGMFGTEEKLGKSVTSDLKEGKKTLLILDALEKSDHGQREIIDLSLGNKRATYAILKKVRRVIKETGALDMSKMLARELTEGAIDAVRIMPLEKEGKDFLLNIAEFLINREY